MVLPGEKDRKAGIPLVAAQIWVFTAKGAVCPSGTSLNSRNHLLTPTHGSIIRNNLFSVVLLSCSLRKKQWWKWRERKKSIWEDGTGKAVGLRQGFVWAWSHSLPVQVLKGTSSEVAESVLLPVVKMQLSPLVRPKQTVKGDSMWVFTVFFSPLF